MIGRSRQFTGGASELKSSSHKEPVVVSPFESMEASSSGESSMRTGCDNDLDGGIEANGANHSNRCQATRLSVERVNSNNNNNHNDNNGELERGGKVSGTEENSSEQQYTSSDGRRKLSSSTACHPLIETTADKINSNSDIEIFPNRPSHLNSTTSTSTLLINRSNNLARTKRSKIRETRRNRQLPVTAIDKQTGNSNNQSVVVKRTLLGGKERSSSITSDYFSSPSHSSPVISQSKQIQKVPKTTTTTTTTIYENPAYLNDDAHLQNQSSKTATNRKKNILSKSVNKMNSSTLTAGQSRVSSGKEVPSLSSNSSNVKGTTTDGSALMISGRGQEESSGSSSSSSSSVSSSASNDSRHEASPSECLDLELDDDEDSKRLRATTNSNYATTHNNNNNNKSKTANPSASSPAQWSLSVSSSSSSSSSSSKSDSLAHRASIADTSRAVEQREQLAITADPSMGRREQVVRQHQHQHQHLERTNWSKENVVNPTNSSLYSSSLAGVDTNRTTANNNNYHHIENKEKLLFSSGVGDETNQASGRSNYSSLHDTNRQTVHRRLMSLNFMDGQPDPRPPPIPSQQHANHPHYYYSPTTMMMTSTNLPDSSNNYNLTGGGGTMRTSLSNSMRVPESTNSSSDYHYYQVVVPNSQASSSASTSGEQAATNSTSSPCRSIQRIVSSLFSQQQQQQQQQQHPLPSTQAQAQSRTFQQPLPAIPSISDQSNRLIDSHRSSSSSSYQLAGHNKTLIDMRNNNNQTLNNFHYKNQNHLARYVQHHPLPMELTSVDQQQQQQQHYYCGLSTLRPLYNQPIELFTAKQPVRQTLTSNNNIKSRRPNLPSVKLCLLLLLLATSLSLLLLALLASTNNNRQLDNNTVNEQVTNNINNNKVAPQPVYGIAKHELLAPQILPPINSNELQQQQAPFLPPSIPPFPSTTHVLLATQPTAYQHTTSKPPIDSTLQTVAPSTIEPPKFWISAGPSRASCISGIADECNRQGQCDEFTNLCRCFSGFSGPTCAQVQCQNNCSQRGQCQAKAESPIDQTASDSNSNSNPIQTLNSFGFASLTASLSLNSVCPRDSNNNNLTALSPARLVSLPGQFQHLTLPTYDYRVQWECNCDPGFAGPDCSRTRELQCEDERDDDLDGLTDCEDDDCCAQPACRENLMCFRSPEPREILAINSQQSQQQQVSSDLLVGSLQHQPLVHSFHQQMRFLIANGSVQSYAKDPAFERIRTAVIRGRVVKQAEPQAGIVGVRVSILESAQFGFTLSRLDGHFDMLVNGNEWLTLQFHRNAYVPIKRKLFIRANAINVLEQDVEMWLASSSSVASQTTLHAPDQQKLSLNSGPFQVQLATEFHKLAGPFAARDEQRKRLFDCLMEQVALSNHFPTGSLQDLQPKLVESGGVELLSSFILASGPAAFSTKIQTGTRIEPTYNSALFPPANSIVKPTLSIQLIPHDQELDHELSGISIELDIEGQTRRERLVPLPGLTYNFAWNRRNVYDQKVYGFGQLIMRIGYEYTFKPSSSSSNINASASQFWSRCAQPDQTLDLNLIALLTSSRTTSRLIWFQRQFYLEAHHLNQHPDLGKWSLPLSNRLDSEHQLVYFGAGWSLPYKLAYPLVVSSPIPLSSRPSLIEGGEPGTRMLARGPNALFALVRPSSSSSARLVLIDTNSRRRILDLPLSVLTSKMGIAAERMLSLERDDLQILYNNYLSVLYISSKWASKIVQVSYSSLLVLNRTLGGGSPTAAADDEIDIDPLCGFGRQPLSSSSPSDALKPSRLVRLAGPHSMTLDEERQILYFIDGPTNLMALDLSSLRVSLLPALAPIKRSTVSSEEQTSAPCSSKQLSLQWFEFKPIKLHSLVWSRAESSLFFIDQDMVFALRQDFSLEVVAAGAAANLPKVNACFTPRKLGLIKTLVADETKNDLLLVHQWTPQVAFSLHPTSKQEELKIPSHFYLAKVKLGIKHFNSTPSSRIIDLHSASETWNPLILHLASAQQQQQSPKESKVDLKSSIIWNELAKRPSGSLKTGGGIWRNDVGSGNPAGSSSGQSSQMSNTIPFIHLGEHFERIDSIEINSDGSIFVLDSSAHSIRTVAPYSPNDFNLIERHDVNINRLFATNSDPSSSSSSSSTPLHPSSSSYPSPSFPQHHHHLHRHHTSSSQVATTTTTTTDELQQLAGVESRKLNVLIVQNPITNELMEFHSTSGLQISLISPPLDQNDAQGIKSEFYYRILANNNKMIELDEDDKYDYQVQKLVSYYISFMGNNSLNPTVQTQITNVYVRLNKIVDSTGNHYELQRLYTGSRFVLQSILINQQSVCEVAADYLGILTTYQQSGKDYWIELTYDTLTYLLRDIATKVEGTSEQSSSSSDLYDPNNQSLIKGWKQLKRIVYDKLFYHYCDLFLVNT